MDWPIIGRPFIIYPHNLLTDYIRDIRTWHARCHIDHPVCCRQHRRGIIGVITACGSFLDGFVTHFIVFLCYLRAACTSLLLCPSSTYPSTVYRGAAHPLPRHQPFGRARIRTIFSIPTLSLPCSSRLHYFLHAFSLSTLRIRGSTRLGHDELAASRYLLVKTFWIALSHAHFIALIAVQFVIDTA